MRILITGGTGFIGSYTVQELKKRGHQLLGISRKAHREPGIMYIKGSLSDIAAWKSKVKKFKPDAAIHLAWEGIPDFSYERCVANMQDGLSLFTMLADIGCKKIVAAGTGFECGARTGKIPEDIDVLPVGAFTTAKHALHLLGDELAKEKGMDFIWMRPFNPYGDGQRSGSLIPYIMHCVVNNVPLTLKKPLAQGDFVYITDAAQAIAHAVVHGKGLSTYNIGSGYLTPVRDIATMICEGMGASKPYIDAFTATAKGKLSPGPYADISKGHKELQWKPVVSMKEGIQKTIRAYKK
jgi:UDP-glucose 4-epimerase